MEGFCCFLKRIGPLKMELARKIVFYELSSLNFRRYGFKYVLHRNSGTGSFNIMLLCNNDRTLNILNIFFSFSLKYK